MNEKKTTGLEDRSEGEDCHTSPLNLRTNVFDNLTAMHYIGSPEPDNPNVILDFFRQQGSPYKNVVRPFLQVAEAKTLAMNIDAVDFYLHAVLWALKHGAVVNGSSSRQSSLDVVRKLMGKPALAPIINTLREVENCLLQRGAMTKAELDEEENSNTDYYKELDRMRLSSL